MLDIYTWVFPYPAPQKHYMFREILGEFIVGAFNQSLKDVVQQKILLELISKLSPLHLNSDIPLELF